MVSLQKSIAICMLYAGTSLTISMTNKLLLSQYKFQGTFLLLACQLAGALFFVSLFKMCHKVGIFKDYIPEVPNLEWDKFKKSIPVSTLFVANVGSAFLGLRVTDVPMFLCVRRLTTICVMVSEYIVLGKVATPKIRMAVGIIMFGTIVAGWDTLTSNYIGYAYVMSNNVLTAVLYAFQKKLCDDTGLKSFGLLYYNAMFALPLSLYIAYMTGEVETLPEFKHLHNPGFLAGMALSSVLGVLMTYAILLCNLVNSPLATSVTGNTKDIVSTFVGWALFGGFLATVNSLSGLLISFVGSGYYSYLKLTANMASAKAAPEGDKAKDSPLPKKSKVPTSP